MAFLKTLRKFIFSANGKRPHDGSAEHNVKEDAWALDDVIFIHEETSPDVAVVKIVRVKYIIRSSEH